MTKSLEQIRQALVQTPQSPLDEVSIDAYEQGDELARARE